MKILVVDDNPTITKVLETILTIYGEVRVCSGGSEALEAVKEMAGQSQYFDLICLDIMMPGMDGHEVLRDLRKIEADNGVESGSKVMMITALGDPINVSESYRQNCDAYLVKPFTRHQIQERLEKLGLIEES